MRELFGRAVTLSLRLEKNNTLYLRTTLNLTELKERLTDLLICSYSCMEAMPIHSNLRYTGQLFGQINDFVENRRHLYSMVLVITSSGYLFFNKIFFKKSSSGLEQIFKARCSKVFTKLILHLGEQNKPHRMYDLVNISLREINVYKPKVVFEIQSLCYIHFRTNTLGKGMNPLILPAMG